MKKKLIICGLIFFSLGLVHAEEPIVKSIEEQSIEQGYYDGFEEDKGISKELSESFDMFFDFKEISFNGYLPPSIICEEREKLSAAKPDILCKVSHPARNLYKEDQSNTVITWKDFVMFAEPVDFEVNKESDFYKLGFNLGKEMKEHTYVKIYELMDYYQGMLVYKMLNIPFKNEN